MPINRDKSFFVFNIQTAFWVFFGLLLAGCYERKAGCLDLEASNWDASADKNCCCEYPKLKLEVRQRMDTLFFSPDSFYQNDLGQSFRLREALFYLSEFELKQMGQALRVADTVRLKLWPPAGGDTLQQSFTDDFLLVRRGAVDNEVGEFRTSGTFDSLRFRLGLPAAVREVIPQKAPTGHPLAVQPEGMWVSRDTGFVYARLVVERTVNAALQTDTLAFTRLNFDNLVMRFGGIFTHRSGTDFKLILKVDYLKLVQGVNLSEPDISTLKSQLTANWPAVFSVSQ